LFRSLICPLSRCYKLWKVRKWDKKMETASVWGNYRVSVKEVFLQPAASSSAQVHWVYLWEFWVCYYFVILGLSEQMFWSQDPIKRPLKTALVLPCNLSSSNKFSELLTEHTNGNGRTEIIAIAMNTTWPSVENRRNPTRWFIKGIGITPHSKSWNTKGHNNP